MPTRKDEDVNDVVTVRRLRLRRERVLLRLRELLNTAEDMRGLVDEHDRLFPERTSSLLHRLRDDRLALCEAIRADMRAICCLHRQDQLMEMMEKADEYRCALETLTEREIDLYVELWGSDEAPTSSIL